MEVWIHPSLRIKALGLTPSSWIHSFWSIPVFPILYSWRMFHHFLYRMTHLAVRYAKSLSQNWLSYRHFFCYHISWLYSTPLFNRVTHWEPAPIPYSVTQCGKPSSDQVPRPWCSPVHGGYVIVVECTNARVLYFAPQYPRWESNP